MPESHADIGFSPGDHSDIDFQPHDHSDIGFTVAPNPQPGPTPESASAPGPAESAVRAAGEAAGPLVSSALGLDGPQMSYATIKAAMGGDEAAKEQLYQHQLGMAQGSLSVKPAAKAARAKKMGFDTSKTYYHGTGADFDTFKIPEGDKGGRDIWGRGIYVADHPNLAADYVPDEGGRILPVHIKVEKPFNLEEPISKEFVETLKKDYPFGKTDKAQLDQLETNKQLHYFLQQYGFGSEKYTNALKKGGYDAVMAPGDRVVSVFSPSQIRSKFAEFDPKKASSGNISAGLVGAAGAGAAAEALTPQSEPSPEGGL